LVRRQLYHRLTRSGDEDGDEEYAAADEADDGADSDAAERRRRRRGQPIWPDRAPADWVRPRGIEEPALHQTEVDLAQAFHDDLTEIGAIEACTRCDERWPLLGVNGTGACRRCQSGGSRHARMFCAANYRCGPSSRIARADARQAEASPTSPSSTTCRYRWS
jgi:hypothetical protein